LRERWAALQPLIGKSNARRPRHPVDNNRTLDTAVLDSTPG
jgi:hypothetical protein